MRAFRGILSVSLAAWACSEARQQEGSLAHPVSWEPDIAPLFSAQCNSCHSGPNAPLGYRTTSYLEALGPTSAPVAVAGDASSKLLKTIDPATPADAVHAKVSGAFSQAKAWVVEGRLSANASGVHEGGILNPNDAQFHSHLVRDQNWNFALCQSCHGADLSGGAAGVSCQDCHSLQVAPDGSTSCASCHGSAQSVAPPRDLAGNTATSALGVGAHQAHVSGKTLISAPIPCSACHVVPAEVGSHGHIDGLRPAELTFSGLAVADGATPSWDRSKATCSNVYCHGNGGHLSGTDALLRAPVWTLGTTQAFCGACHGAPPSAPHPRATFPNCAGCHPYTVRPDGNIIVTGTGAARTSFHINGVIDAP